MPSRGRPGVSEVYDARCVNRLHFVTLTEFDEQSGKASRVPLKNTRVWLRADRDFVRNTAGFRYGTDGTRYVSIGEPYTTAYGLITSPPRWP